MSGAVALSLLLHCGAGLARADGAYGFETDLGSRYLFRGLGISRPARS